MNGSKNSFGKVALICIVLLLGFFLRFYSLDHLSYWGDEETSSLPAKSLALGEGAKFPSGMEYRRGLPHTYLMAQTSKTLGIDSDYAYRIPSAVLGSLTLIILFFLAYQFFGINVAIVATIILSFSELHILLSRTARMYGPMLLFSVIFYYFVFLWHRQKNIVYIFGSSVSLLVSVSFNFLAILALPLLIVPFLHKKLDYKHLSISIVAAGSVAIASILYFRLYVTAPYRNIFPENLKDQKDSGAQNLIESVINQASPEMIAAALGSIILAVLTYQSFRFFNKNKDNFISCIFLFSSILCLYLFGILGHFFGAFLFAIFVLSVIDLRSPTVISALKTPIIFLFFAFCFWLSFNIMEYGVAEGLKRLFRFPFPYILYQAKFFFGLTVLFFIGFIYSLFKSDDKHNSIRSAAVTYLFVSLFVGLTHDWPPPRYMVTIYPLLIIVASYGLVCLSDQIQYFFGKVRFLRYLVILILPASGVLGGHGVPQAIRTVPGDHGMLIYSNHIQGIIYPDHRSLGCFVRGHLKASDIVVAQDALQQYWYVGKVDYWLRNPGSINSFMFRSNGVLKDIYVLSEPTSDEIIKELRDSNKRIWIITSGEVYNFKDHFLGVNTPQRKWIDHIENSSKPLITGLDNASAVYCINCNSVLGAPESATGGACSQSTY